MEARGKPIHHLKEMFLKVSDSILHFKGSSTPIMAICVSMKATCSYGLLHLSNLDNEGGLEPSKIVTSHISFESGWDPTVSSPQED